MTAQGDDGRGVNPGYILAAGGRGNHPIFVSTFRVWFRPSAAVIAGRLAVDGRRPEQPAAARRSNVAGGPSHLKVIIAFCPGTRNSLGQCASLPDRPKLGEPGAGPPSAPFILFFQHKLLLVPRHQKDGKRPVTGRRGFAWTFSPSAAGRERYTGCMSDVTRLLDAAAAGDRKAAADLLPLVYDELRKLAAARMAAEAPGHTLDATALVHEAYLRLVGDQQFTGRTHFLATAAEAMRRILVDRALPKARAERGGGRRRLDLRQEIAVHDLPPDDLLDLTDALDALGAEDSAKAELVKLRFFGGLSVEEAAGVLGISRATADRYWTYSRAWLHDHLSSTE